MVWRLALALLVSYAATVWFLHDSSDPFLERDAVVQPQAAVLEPVSPCAPKQRGFENLPTLSDAVTDEWADRLEQMCGINVACISAIQSHGQFCIESVAEEISSKKTRIDQQGDLVVGCIAGIAGFSKDRILKGWVGAQKFCQRCSVDADFRNAQAKTCERLYKNEDGKRLLAQSL